MYKDDVDFIPDNMRREALVFSSSLFIASFIMVAAAFAGFFAGMEGVVLGVSLPMGLAATIMLITMMLVWERKRKHGWFDD